MTADAIARDRADALLAYIADKLNAQILAPFGDAPIELEIARELRAEGMPDAQLALVLEIALQSCFSRVVHPDAALNDFRLFGSLAFVARFVGVPLDQSAIEGVVILLLRRSRADSEARFALTDFLRTLARTGSPISLGALELEPDDHPELIEAAIELLVANGDETAFHWLAHLAERNEASPTLFWTLAHTPAFNELLAATDRGTLTILKKDIVAALDQLDPSGAAALDWTRQTPTEVAPADESWSAFDYRELELEAEAA